MRVAFAFLLVPLVLAGCTSADEPPAPSPEAPADPSSEGASTPTSPDAAAGPAQTSPGAAREPVVVLVNETIDFLEGSPVEERAPLAWPSGVDTFELRVEWVPGADAPDVGVLVEIHDGSGAQVSGCTFEQGAEASCLRGNAIRGDGYALVWKGVGDVRAHVEVVAW